MTSAHCHSSGCLVPNCLKKELMKLLGANLLTMDIVVAGLKVEAFLDTRATPPFVPAPPLQYHLVWLKAIQYLCCAWETDNKFVPKAWVVFVFHLTMEKSLVNSSQSLIPRHLKR